MSMSVTPSHQELQTANHVSVSVRVLQKCHFKLRNELDVPSLLPYLNKYRLITADFHEELTLQATHAEKVDKLVAQLPRNGTDFLERLIQCLRESVEDEPATAHGQLAYALEEELKLQITHALVYNTETTEADHPEGATEITPLLMGTERPDKTSDGEEGRSSFGERVLRNCQGRLRRELNVLSLLPYLNKYRLITADFHEELTLPATHAAKVDKLVAQLPRSGADFLEHFIQCLRESVEDEPGTFHGQIADALKEELKLQITRGFEHNEEIAGVYENASPTTPLLVGTDQPGNKHEGGDSVSVRVLQKGHIKLQRKLNIPILLPYLNHYHLITADLHEELTLEIPHTTKVNRLVTELSRSGADFLERFIQCLQESAEVEEVKATHQEIADALEELKLQELETSGTSALTPLLVDTDQQDQTGDGEEVLMSDEKAQTIVDQALESGSLEQRNTVATVVGIVGSGKTWLISRLFRIKPPDRYTSTGVAEKSFRGLMRHIATINSWKLLSQEQILEVLAPFIQAGLTKADIISLAKTFTEDEVSEVTQAPLGEVLSPLQPTTAPTTLPSPSPSRSWTIATTHPLQEKSYANKTMINLVQTVKGSTKALIIELLHMIDTGGQPEFMEIMPSLIHNSNLTLLVLNLAQSLDEYPQFAFYDDGTAFKRPLPSLLTNGQVIHQFARTLQAKWPKYKASQHFKVTVIATHRDCVKGKLSETLSIVNKELKHILLPAMEDELIVYRSPDEITFPVNLLNPDENDEKVLELIRQCIIDADIGEKVKIPLSFFMFEQDVIKYAEQKKGKDRQIMVLSFDECVQVGERLKMSKEVVQAALTYFHRHNIFLYFQRFLPNLIFLNPQVPLDFVNAIVAFSYKVKSGNLSALPAKYERFCTGGIITEEMLYDKTLQLSHHFIPGIYDPKDAITLFLHIYTIAKLTNEEPRAKFQQPHAHTRGPREYLMMCLLDDKPEYDIQECLPSPSKIAPLVIQFGVGCVPNGCFGNTISCLISTCKWKICQTEEGSPKCLAHNIVTLHDPMLPVTVTMVHYTRHLEIHVNMENVEKDFNEICLRIRTTVFSAIEKVFNVMKFEDIELQPAFLCPCKCSPTHAATVCDFLLGGSYTVCSKTGKSVGCLQKEQQLWFQDVKKVQQSRVTLPELIRFKTTSGKLREQIGTHYRDLGYLLLNDTKGEVTRSIIKSCGPDVTDIISEIFRLWVQGEGMPVEWATLVEVLKDIGLTELAHDMEQTLK